MWNLHSYDDFFLKDKKLSVVLPAYNEGARLFGNALEVNRAIGEFAADYEVILVNDGSSDNTFHEAMRARQLDPKHIKVISYSNNRGKGGAIKIGVQKAKGELIAFLDSDLDLSPLHLRGFVCELLKNDADIVIGSKLHKESKVDYPAIRRITSYGYYIMLKLLFRLNTKDTQTGIKLYRADVIKPIIKNIMTRGYAFDIEILASAAKDKRKIVEMPVEVIYTRNTTGSGSRIRIKDIIRMFSDTIHIKRKLR